MVALRISLMDAFPGCKTSTFEARKNLVGFRKRGLCEARTDPAKHGLGECVSHNKSYTASGLVILCVTCIPASVAMSCHAADGELSVHEMVNSPGVADKSLNSAAVEAVQHFFTGGIGGCVGAAAVFPIDLVKTRQQAREDDRQTRETGPLRRLMSGFDCFTDIVRHEGPGGLYSGLSAQLIGVWPEKAVKLTANDFLRSFLTDPATGSLSAVAQIAAGAFGGLCQVVFTNPLEVVKIQLQLDGARLPAAGDRQHESANHASAAAGPTSGTRMRPTPGRSKSLLVETVREIGVAGLYRGAHVCAARDMLFSGIYFPLFSALKDAFLEQGHHGGVWLLLAGTLAGAPAAYLSTPMDMLKTRLQADLRPGAPRPGTLRCWSAILEEGGWRALFTGGAARVFRSAPQFGVTLLVYDRLNELIGQAAL